MVVHEQDADLISTGVGHHNSSPTGNSASNFNPRPGALSRENVPPDISTRSRMPLNPNLDTRAFDSIPQPSSVTVSLSSSLPFRSDRPRCKQTPTWVALACL